MHALVKYGPPAGLCYMGIPAYVMIGICRPTGNLSKPPAGPVHWACPVRANTPLALVPLLAALPLGRVIFGGSGDDPGCSFTKVRLSDDPAADIAGDIRVAGPGAPEGTGPAREGFAIAVGCALAGFILHNLIEFGLSMPGTATFMGVSRRALAGGRRRASRSHVRGQDLAAYYRRRLTVLLPVLVVAASILQYWLPVYQRTELTQKMRSRFTRDERIPPSRPPRPPRRPTSSIRTLPPRRQGCCSIRLPGYGPDFPPTSGRRSPSTRSGKCVNASP